MRWHSDNKGKGELLTKSGFRKIYGKNKLQKLWDKAPHFQNMQAFLDFSGLRRVIQPGCLIPSGVMSASSAIFGLWLPTTHLLLVSVHHLEGKLRRSRIAPETGNWSRELWKNAWRIGSGQADNQVMMVLDYNFQLFESGYPLGTLGEEEMEG